MKTKLHLVPVGLFVAVAVGVGTIAPAADAEPAPKIPPTIKPAEPQPAPPPDKDGVRLDGDVHWTAASGDTAEAPKILGHSNDFQAFYGLEWWEDGDDPCKFAASTRHLNQQDNAKVDTADFCSGSAGNKKTILRRAPNEYVSSIQVCTTDKKDSARDKIKGVRLWGRTVDTKSGALGPENGPEEVRHTNCKTWKAKVSCPAGTVASKIKVYAEHWSGTSGAGYGRGIALGCRRVLPK